MKCESHGALLLDYILYTVFLFRDLNCVLYSLVYGRHTDLKKLITTVKSKMYTIIFIYKFGFLYNYLHTLYYLHNLHINTILYFRNAATMELEVNIKANLI